MICPTPPVEPVHTGRMRSVARRNVSPRRARSQTPEGAVGARRSSTGATRRDFRGKSGCITDHLKSVNSAGRQYRCGLSLLYLFIVRLSPSATLAEAADGAVYGVFGSPSTPPKSHHGNCCQRKSKPAQPFGARGQKPTGPRQNASRGSWPFGPTPDTISHRKRHVFSGLRHQGVVSVSRYANGSWHRSGRLRNSVRMIGSTSWRVS